MEENKQILPNITNIKSTESFTLPSKGLVYAPELKIPSSITLRRMTTREDKMRMRNSSENVIRRDILQACIMNEGVNASNLKLIDANFLLFRLRVLSLLDDTYKISVICPHCGTEFIHEIKLSEVPVTYLSEDDMKSMNVELPISHQQIVLKFPSLEDMILASDQLAEYSERFPDADKAEYLFTVTHTLYIDSVNGNKMMRMELEDWLDGLDIVDSRELITAIGKLENMFGFVEELIAICPSCKKEVPHGLPITRELFTPSK